MKIKIFFNGRFLTQPITGVQRTAYELVTAIDLLIEKNQIESKEFEFYLIYSGKIINSIELKNIKILKKGLLKGNLWEQFELPLYTYGYLLVSMCTISSLMKKKQIVVVHDASFKVNPQYFSFFFRIWYQQALKILGKVALHIVTVSEFSKNELVEHVGFEAKKISVIYNAADHMKKLKPPEDPFKERINKLKPYCLAVSSLSINKNYKGLSEAISKIKFFRFTMLIAGGKSASLRSSGISEYVKFLGYITDEQLKYLYQNAALFIFPSFYEGFGIPPLEAMSLGCPVLASNTSALPEVLGDACEYFDPKNADDLAEKIQSLGTNETALQVLKKKGHHQATKYKWSKSAMNLYSLINKYGR